ncbi:MAG: N-6 DNA methylase [Methanoregula sp.]|nr:N-6 DNA methylase [Methanoregula sp.]
MTQSPEWKKNDHVAVFEQIKALYTRESAFLETLNEKQLEERFFKPIFTHLGHVFEVTAGTQSRDIPDFGFFSERIALDDAHLNKDKRDFYTNAIAIGEVKQWKIDLDRIGASNTEAPSRQIWRYLSVTDPTWGILSNGRLWRLYCKSRRYDSYLEINLPDLIATNDTEGFRFFYYFLRKEAFVSSKDGSAFLDRVLKGSIDYATAIGGSLKKNVYWAMKRIAEGLVERRSNNLDKNDPVTLARVQNSTMILLYRFLFLLYAEGKGLLNLNDERYLNYYSFRRIVREIAERQDGPIGKRYDPVNITIQTQLETLFDLINQGSAGFPILEEGENGTKIPAYNGGLFDPKKHPDLEQWEIGDQFLAEAIDYLSRSELKEGHRDFVDYSTLDIRHLGSIYEGLLEYTLRIAQLDLVVCDDEWISLDEYNKDRKQKKAVADFEETDRVKIGQLYLATDKGERKSTGSYYTPDYIVNNIVKDTVGSVVEKKWREAQECETSYIDATLSINVLDPAMGSGHFLVGAVDFLSQKLLDAVRMDCAAGRITDTTPYTNDWARRDVVSHCIYGVDLNELAVELAKVGLWLTTISRDKPLSFLDHRLKQGNSLIGAKLTKLRYYPGKEIKEMSQSELPTSISPRFIGHILAKIAELEAIEDNKLEDVKRKEKAFEEFKQLPEYRKAKGLANVYTAIYFGNVITPSEAIGLKKARSSETHYQDLVWEIAGDEEYKWKRVTNYEWFRRAELIAQEKSFFHWELEFPEIFFDAGKLRENPGWDAVIGNPPWGADFDPLSKEFITINYKSASGEMESHIFFTEKGSSLINSDGLLGFITPNTWLSQKRGVNLRKYLLNNCSIVEIQHLAKNIFEDVPDIVPVIFTLSKGTGREIATVKILKNGLKNISLVDDNFELINHIDVKKWRDDKEYSFNIYLSDSVDELLKKIELKSEEVSKNFDVHYGIKTGGNEKYLFESKLKDNYVPCLEKGAEIRRYEIKWHGRYLDYGNYLNGYKKHNLEVPKIIIQYTRKLSLKRRIVAGLDTEGKFYPLNRFSYIFSKANNYSILFLMAIISSNLLNYYHANKFIDYDIKPTYLQKHPIRRILFTTPIERRNTLLNEAKGMYNTILQSNDPQPLLAFVENRRTALPEETDVIHDLLAFLAERMVEMNKEKNAEIKTFLEFVENETGSSINALQNKTLIQEYYIHDFTDFLEVLVQNKNKLKEGYNPKGRTHHDILKDWYNSSLTKLKPLISKTETTDYLVDQIVYRLYGLTEQEISVVAGAHPTGMEQPDNSD